MQTTSLKSKRGKGIVLQLKSPSPAPSKLFRNQNGFFPDRMFEDQRTFQDERFAEALEFLEKNGQTQINP